MKYSQEYARILEDSGFPLEWRESSIEYKKLKKLIKNVSKELSSLGLNPVVLNRLLNPPDVHTDSSPPNSSAAYIHPSESPSESSSRALKRNNSADSAVLDELEFEFLSEGSSSVDLEVDVAAEGPTLEPAAATDEGREGRHRSVQRWVDETGKRFRVRVREDRSESDLEAMADEEDETSRPAGSARRVDPRRKSTGYKRDPISVRGGFTAEYEIGGSAQHPVPRIRLVPIHNSQRRRLSSSSNVSRPESVSSRDPSPSSYDSRVGIDASVLEERTPKPRSSPPIEHLMASTSAIIVPRGPQKDPLWSLTEGAEEGLAKVKRPSPPAPSTTPTVTTSMTGLTLVEPPEEEDDDEDEDEEVVVPPGFTPALGLNPSLGIPVLSIQPATPEGLLKTGGGGREIKDDEMFELDGGGSALDVSSPEFEHIDGFQPPQELYLDLASDREFFNVLTHALQALDTLQRNQQALFRQKVDFLCEMISAASEVSQTTARKHKLGAKVKATLSSNDGHSDLYAWREIFTLWIEAEIFESSAERDRGERTVDEAEKRLKAFAGELTKRGLGDKRTLKSKSSRDAFNTFLQLNLTLLDLKKFHTANIEAARKILKKHDKRTALTASRGFPEFVVSSLDANSGNVRTWTLFDSSLPHVLLSSLTSTLLPIIPSLEDYSCLICTSIAFKPIRLDCGHLFCVRCLAKMQRRGKDQCPLCRAPVLAIANARNLDTEAMKFMKQFFPREVKVKQRENELEVAREDMEDSGMDVNCVIC